MKELKKLVIALSSVIIIFIIGGFFYNKYLDKELSRYYGNSIASYYGLTEKERGLALQAAGIRDKNFMLFGSSELSSPVPQNPSKFFPNKDNDFIVNIIGRGYTQNLHHLINFASLGNDISNKKIGLVVSLQWFYDKEGISSGNFQMNFSELQFYRLINNDTIDEALKKEIAERVYKLMRNRDLHKNIPTLYAYLYSRENKLLRLGYYILKPYYSFREYYLETKDKSRSIAYLKKNNIKDLNTTNLKDINWENETKVAEEMGKKAAKNNDYYVEDQYFDQYLKPKMDIYKDYFKDVNLLDSNEFKNYELLLKTCKSLNIKPYIILMPVNGYFYDYMGLGKEERHAFYDKLSSLAGDYGFKVLNMKDKDYEPYFMTDIMHLGWKGWLYVDEKIAEYNKTN